MKKRFTANKKGWCNGLMIVQVKMDEYVPEFNQRMVLFKRMKIILNYGYLISYLQLQTHAIMFQNKKQKGI